MPRPKGLAKTGGRTRGTLNKSTEEIVSKLQTLGCDPLEGLARIALDPSTKPELKARCFSELAQYVYPKRRPIESVPIEREICETRVIVEHIGARTVDSLIPPGTKNPGHVTSAPNIPSLIDPSFR